MLNIEKSSHGSDVILKLSGPLTEEGALPKISDPIDGRLVIDLERVIAINSLGGRNWALWIQTLKAKGGVFVQNCPPVFVHQMNVLVNFLGQNVRVLSFYAPYICTACNREERKLYHVNESSNQVTPEIGETDTCPACGGVMDIDVLKDRYTNFLKKT